MSKKLVAYFSASGNTASLAKKLAEAAGADLYEITPAVPYTSADLNWQNKQSRSSIEMNDHSSRPAITGTDANIAAYDTVYLGFPVWWYIAPTIINTFLERYDFSGKTILPLCTNEGSGMGGSENNIKKLTPGATVKKGLPINGSSAASSGPSVERWLKANGLL